MNNLTTTQSQVYDLTGLDGIDDFSSMAVIDSAGLITSQPKNRISIKGKLFTFQLADGTQVDANTPTLDAVILNVSPYQSKAFFDKPHDDPTSQMVCASSNGKAPDAWIQNTDAYKTLLSEGKVARSCALCPNNVQGSGKDGKGKACGDSKDIAVLISQYPTTPFLIRLGVTSIISFRNYVNDLTKQLRAMGKIKDPKGIAPLHLFMTKLSFKTRDHKGEVAGFPILDFTYAATLPKEQWPLISEMAVSEEVKKLIRTDDLSLAEHMEPSGSGFLGAVSGVNTVSAPPAATISTISASTPIVEKAIETAKIAPVTSAESDVKQTEQQIYEAALAGHVGATTEGFVI